jgi:hypothetical protein
MVSAVVYSHGSGFMQACGSWWLPGRIQHLLIAQRTQQPRYVFLNCSAGYFICAIILAAQAGLSLGSTLVINASQGNSSTTSDGSGALGPAPALQDHLLDLSPHQYTASRILQLDKGGAQEELLLPSSLARGLLQSSTSDVWRVSGG